MFRSMRMPFASAYVALHRSMDNFFVPMDGANSDHVRLSSAAHGPAMRPSRVIAIESGFCSIEIRNVSWLVLRHAMTNARCVPKFRRRERVLAVA